MGRIAAALLAVIGVACGAVAVACDAGIVWIADPGALWIVGIFAEWAAVTLAIGARRRRSTR